MRDVSGKVVKKIKTHILLAVTSFYFPPLSVCLLQKSCRCGEIMWKNIVEPDRLQMAVCSVRIACWKLKATNTHF
jgi:hypothetical protein